MVIVSKQLTARGIAIASLLFTLALPLTMSQGCTGDQTTSRSNQASSEAQRQISEADALADFDAAWQIVYDTHFDTTFNGVDWIAVRDELRPSAAKATNQRQLRMVMQDMLGRLGQSHFAIIPSTAAEPQPNPEPKAEPNDEPDRISMDHDHEGNDNAHNDEYNESRAIVPEDNGDGQGDADTGIDLRILGGHAVVSSVRESSPADRMGVKTGWVLASIRQRDVDEMLGQLRDAIGEQDMGIHAVAMLSDQLQGREGSPIELTFLDGTDQEIVLDIEREPMPGEFVKFGNLPPMSTHLDWSRVTQTDAEGNEVNIGIIRFNIWMIPIAPKFERAMYELRDCDGLIIDLRGNPGGVGALSASVGRFLMSEKGSLGTMAMRGAELQFNIEPVIVTTWGEPIDPFSGPIAILQDSGSASTSEVFAGGLQSLGRVKVFGTRSAGMALPAGMDKLPSGDVLLHAIADFTTSTGARMEHGGVIPDVEVGLTRDDLLKGIDTTEQAAKDWIAGSAEAR